MLENITQQPLPISIESILVNIIVGAILAFLIKFHFVKYSSSLSNKIQFSNIFPILVLTTLLVISIVKSSLALSLGLVGALSIVRFRTPIKEPEELGYLFLSIAAGLGLGANQTSATFVSVIIILVVISVFKNNQLKKNSLQNKNILLNLIINKVSKNNKNDTLLIIQEILKKNSLNFELRRFELKDTNLELYFITNFKDYKNLQSTLQNLQKRFPSIAISYVDQKQISTM